MTDTWQQAGDFALTEGESVSAQVIGDAWDVYAGARTDNTLARLIAQDKVHARSYFVNDNYWWVYTDSQCNFHSTFGWRPFFDRSYRQVDYNSWVRFFECQVDERLKEHFLGLSAVKKSPPVGFFPHSVFPDKDIRDMLPMFYSNSFEPGDESHERHSEEIDYQLMNIISATDWVLFEHSVEIAGRVLHQVELFMRALEERIDPDGMLLVGPQGSQIEFAHGGWRYPAITHVYLLRVCRNMIEVAGMVEAGEDRERWEEREKRTDTHLGSFLQNGKWFAGAIDRSRSGRLGTGLIDGSPSSYFETWPNLNSIVLGVSDRELGGSILDRMDEIPQLTKNTLVLNNYPKRPREEMDDDHEGFPKPGDHMNGGSWWMLTASLMYASAALGRPNACRYLGDALALQHAHLTIDGYYNWGQDPASQFADKGNGAPDHYSIGAAGSFGMFFRGALGITPTADGLKIAPRLPAGITRMKTLAPVYYGGKRLFLEVVDSGRGQEMFLPYSDLPDEVTVTVGLE